MDSDFNTRRNWELQHEVAENKTVEIQLVAPSGAFWSLLAFPIEQFSSLDKQDSPNEDAGETLMQGVLESLRQQYDSIEVAAATETFAKAETAGYDAHFFCLDMLVMAQLRYLKGPQHHLVLMCQAENREYSDMSMVFKAITIGMLGLEAETPELPKFTATA